MLFYVKIPTWALPSRTRPSLVLAHRKKKWCLNWTRCPLSQFYTWSVHCDSSTTQNRLSCPISISFSMSLCTLIHTHTRARVHILVYFWNSAFNLQIHLISCYICFSLVPNELCIYIASLDQYGLSEVWSMPTKWNDFTFVGRTFLDCYAYGNDYYCFSSVILFEKEESVARFYIVHHPIDLIKRFMLNVVISTWKINKF